MMTSEQIFCKSRWIWPVNGSYHLHNSYALFRRCFSLETLPQKALAHLTADQSYQLFVNGQLVCRGPARGYQAAWPYDSVDLAPFLRKGNNCIAIRAYNPGHGTFAYHSLGMAGILFAAKIGRQTLVSDNSWRCRHQTGVRRDTVPYSLQLTGHQEWIDLREEAPAWSRPSFNDADWNSSIHVRGWNHPPHTALEPRGIPMMRETVRRPRLIGLGNGTMETDWESPVCLADLRKREDLEHQPATSKSSATCTVPALKKGAFQSFLLDFGKVVVGSPVLSIKGAQGGEIIDLLHTEVLHPNSLTPKIVGNDHSRIRLANRLICRKGNQTHAFFHPQGFRYLTVTVRSASAPFSIQTSLNACGYPLDGSGDFNCQSDEDLNKIWQACAHTQRICALDAYVDTPWREQAQWWGDARIQAWNTFHLSADVRLLRRGIRILAGQTSVDGLTYGHAPTIAHTCILPDFSLIWILTLWDDYWQTGSTEMLEQHADRVLSILDYFKKNTHPRLGLVGYDPRYWLFLDWRPIQREGWPALLNLWLLEALSKLMRMARASSLPNNFADAPAWHKRLSQAIIGQLMDKDGLVCDGILPGGKRSKSKSLQAQTLAWMSDLPGLNRDRVLKRILLPWIRGERATPLDPSSYWCAYPLDLLAREGYGKDVLAFIRKHWAEMADFGSCFEDFDPHPPGKDMSSHSHAWSAHPLYLLMRIIGGVRATQPGWKSVSVNPIDPGCPAKVIFPTPHGNIVAEWQDSIDKRLFSIQLPKSISSNKCGN
jgi:alpha-L-rhamnosidase